VLHDFYDSDPKRGFYGGGGIDARFLYQPAILALWGGLPPDTPRWGAGFKSSMARYFNYSMPLLSHATCLPLERNMIDLDPEVKDAWGLPAIRVTFEQHPDDLKTLRFKWPLPVEETTFSAHLMGTCRMGNDPRTSVVDRFNRTHDVPNLFIVDGSSLVTCGRQQPTATIQALAYRAADHITERPERPERR